MSSRLTFGERLADLRASRDLTQEDIAKLIGKTPQNVGHYETNNAFPPKDTLILLADFFGVSVDYLIARVDFNARENMIEEKFIDYEGVPITVGKLIEIQTSLDQESREMLYEVMDGLIKGGKLKKAK